MGSIVHKGGDKWLLRTVVGYNQNGNAIRKSKTIKAKNEKQAERQLVIFENELEQQGFVAEKEYKFENFVRNEWLPKYAEKDDAIAYNTRLLYMTYLEKHFFPSIGKKRLKDVTPLMIVNIMDTVKREGNPTKPLSRSTKKNILAAASSVFEVAVDWHLLKKNPAKGVKIGKDMRKDVKMYQPYTTKEISHIFECLQKEEQDFQVMLSIALLTGAREGEIAALEEKHVQAHVEDSRTFYAIMVEQTIIVKKKEGAVLQPYTKTEVSDAVTIPKHLYDAIQSYIADMRPYRKVVSLNGPRFLFCHADGKPYRPTSLSRRFQRFQKRHGIRKVRFHDLRHSNATYMIMEGVPMKIVQERLRHKTLSTTMDIYSHVLKEYDQQAVDTLEKMGNFGGSATILPPN